MTNVFVDLTEGKKNPLIETQLGEIVVTTKWRYLMSSKLRLIKEVNSSPLRRF